jgi:hypothetical protein
MSVPRLRHSFSRHDPDNPGSGCSDIRWEAHRIERLTCGASPLQVSSLFKFARPFEMIHMMRKQQAKYACNPRRHSPSTSTRLPRDRFVTRQTFFRHQTQIRDTTVSPARARFNAPTSFIDQSVALSATLAECRHLPS